MPKKPYKPKTPRADFGTAMFPNLHQDVENALSDESIVPAWWFNHTGGDTDAIKRYSTNIMGRFECRNKGCSKGGWGSKVIAIEIRRYQRNGYNAVVFKQRCRACKKLGAMRLDENSYLERVTYRIKKWAGVEMDTPEYNREKRGPPHESTLCEGCKRGRCPLSGSGGGNGYMSRWL
jgi:hypothetical protein